MTRLLELVAAIALLVWGTQLVRAGVLLAFGANLRYLLARAVGNRFAALTAGLGVTAVVQSSTATSLMAASFVAERVLALPLALAMMLGADIGTSLVALALSLDLSWLSPLCILVGVVMTVARRQSEMGRIFVGLGLVMLALKLVRASTMELTHMSALQGMLTGLGGDVALALTVGAALALVAYSSLAIVLLTAVLATADLLPASAALGLVLGANVGSGLLGVLTTATAKLEARRVPLGNLVFKLGGVALVTPFVPALLAWAEAAGSDAAAHILGFHLAFNVVVALVFIGLTTQVSAFVERCLPSPTAPKEGARTPHLAASALPTPHLALSCAVREAVYQADVVETMLRGIPAALQDNDLGLPERLRALDDTVDTLCSAIKAYLARLAPEALSLDEQRRRGEILAFAINMEQVADIAERVLLDVEERKIRPGRRMSAAGLTEVNELHARLMTTLSLSLGVFLGRQQRDARELVDEEQRFRELERAFANTHLVRYAGNTRESVDTSGLHLDLISELQRVHSHLCAIGYAVLEERAAPFSPAWGSQAP
ncbi:Na/Pi cotransporter family protein [Variovorax sp. 38R]|uniref:Na/Pi cotransporter family protein n=1 Tax=Variovorax sp. 38R TaxID=2774875 RepID=UPI0017846E9E|nr:Na/Pi cotransporter family protein [Variovorax sp. 38R]QOF79873.1 Na/Pi cotransporter family protein [Variovorax sp. 38R]